VAKRKRGNRSKRTAPAKKQALDGFANIAKGIGGAKDVLQNTTFVRNAINLAHNYPLAEELYLNNWLIGNIADIPASEATREWFEISSDRSPDAVKDLKALYKKLNVKQQFKQALAYADLFGGSALYMVVNDGRTQDKPLNLSSIKRGSFTKLRLFDPSHLIPVYRGTGEPTLYTLHGSRGETLTIHRSRLLLFKGLHVTESKRQEFSFWGASRVQRAMEPIIATDTAINAIINMLTEHNVNVYKLDGLTDLAIDDADEDAIKRIQIIDTMKSYLNALVLDAKDDFVKRSNDFKDLHQIDNASLIRVAGAAEIPATLLFGRSPDGMNATGAADFDNFYNRIARVQSEKIEPNLEILSMVASLSLNGSTIDDLAIVANPLKKETKSERAAREKSEADTAKVYIDAGVITKDEEREALARSNPKYSFLPEKSQEKGGDNVA